MRGESAKPAQEEREQKRGDENDDGEKARISRRRPKERERESVVKCDRNNKRPAADAAFEGYLLMRKA